MGMLLHHHHQRLFIERLTGTSLERTSVRETLAEEIARFTLRGLRAGETFVERVLTEARTESAASRGSGPKSHPRSQSKRSRTGTVRRSAPKGTSS